MKLFEFPPNCKSIKVCGEFGFPDRCQTCGHEAYQREQPAPIDKTRMLDDDKDRFEALMANMKRKVISPEE